VFRVKQHSCGHKGQASMRKQSLGRVLCKSSVAIIFYLALMSGEEVDRI